MTPENNAFPPNTVQLYQYWARVDRVVDGDTLDLTVALGFDIQIKQRFRLLGINAPEVFSQRLGSAERLSGEAATAFLASHTPPGSWVEIKVFMATKREKYGRWLGEVFVDGTNINELMVAEGHAVIM